MAKTKELKTGSKAKSEVKPLSKVKNASVTKSSQTPISKSKQVAKEVAAKAINGKKTDKKPQKAPTPSSSEDEDDESADSASESEVESDSEVETKKPIAATNGKANGNGEVAKKEVDTSDSSDSASASDSEASDSEASDSDSDNSKSAAEESDDSDDSEASDEEAAPVATIAKNAVKKTVEAGKAAVNGAAKVVAKAMATEESDEEEDSEASGSSDESDAEANDDEDSEDSEESVDSETEVPSKKRKAVDEPVPSAKKAKADVSADVEETGSKNLFVGNLSWNIDDEWLYREFEEFGEITGARVISDRESGRSKGFGYVEFAKASDAATALKAKKGALIDGREANVDFSTPRDNTAPKERANQRAQTYGDSKNPESDTLFVGNISFEANEDMLGEAFGEHGTVVNVRLPTDMDSGNPKGFGYITFSSVEDAKNAYENMTGAEIAGRPVRLDYATPRPERNGDSPRGGRGRGSRGGFGDRGGRGGGRGGRGGFGDRGGRGGSRGGRGGSTNRGGFGDFAGKKQKF